MGQQLLPHQTVRLWPLTQPGTWADTVTINSIPLNVTTMVETAVSKRLKIGMTIARNANAKEKIARSLLGGAGEMVESAKTNGTMLDASLMVEIAVKIPIAANVKMTWLKSRPIL